MLPTKGYFQDIECPFYNTTCGRPYCHFRHKRKPNDSIEENVQESSNNVVPTYKPTPKSELANIHNSRSHIPISYVPDLSFNRERTIRPIKIDRPTYKPTPLSILSCATKPDLSENHEDQEAIKDIQENIASNVYDPVKSEIDFEDLSNEFELIEDIINDSTEVAQGSINSDLIKLENDIEKEQNRLSLLQSVVVESPGLSCEYPVKVEVNSEEDEAPNVEEHKEVKKEIEVLDIKQEIDDGEGNKQSESKDNKNSKENKSSHKERRRSSDKSKSKDESSSKEKSSKERDLKKSEKTSKSHKSNEREKHRKEAKKNSSKDHESAKDKHKTKHKSKERSKSPKEKKNDKKPSKIKKETPISDSSNDSSPQRPRKESSNTKKQKSRERSRSPSKKRESKSKSSKSRSKSRSTSREKSRHKSKKGNHSHTRHKDKEKTQNKNREDKEKSSKSKDRDKDRKKSSSKEKSSRSNSVRKKHEEDKKEKRKKLTSESNYSTSENNDNDQDVFLQDEGIMDTTDLIPSDVDLDLDDLDDQDETMRECYKIFNEYKPESIKPQPKTEETEKQEDSNAYKVKKRMAYAGAEEIKTYSKFASIAPPKPTPLPGHVLTNRYKIAKMAQANNEQENIMNEIKNITTQQVKRPATSLLEAARQHKIKRLQQQQQQQKALEQAKPNVNIVDDILNGLHRPSASQVKILPKKIAAVPNVALIEKAKQRISLVKQQRMTEASKTIAHTQKGGRVAHVPEYTLAEIPDVIQADKSKLPVNVRTRFLTMIADECSKLYGLREDAFNRALNEEFACYEKCKVLATYRNSAMLAVNRLRKEIQDRESKGLGPLLSGEAPLRKKESDFEGKTFYDHAKKWILTEEELDTHGYPRESGERGKAIINNRIAIDYSIVDENQRKCSRCGKIYQVDDDGWPLFDEECMYHPLKKRTIRGEQVFLCCKSSDDTGCATSDTHVFDGLPKHLLEGYQTTLPPETEDDARSTQVYALDCEMCYTTKGLELTRVTVVDTDCKTVYESLVKPLNPIIDYNTRFSGITKEQMDRTSTSILQVQANILHLCNSETILMGHSLESDMKALKIVHGSIIDTSVLFPHKMGLPHKRALRALASEYLKKIIQNDVAGHDSAEDAVACMDLVKWKLKEELKVRIK